MAAIRHTVLPPLWSIPYVNSAVRGGVFPQFLQDCYLTVSRLYTNSHTTSLDLLFDCASPLFRKVSNFAKGGANRCGTRAHTGIVRKMTNL